MSGSREAISQGVPPSHDARSARTATAAQSVAIVAATSSVQTSAARSTCSTR
ncbi:hypothetical protein AB0A71_24335 [Kitasatospora aureofaciens]|uniref:hypothetical protein n=1 Tax=Kitasatospora aureofaciens TaxID=1894 RepID=UPI0033DB370B